VAGGADAGPCRGLADGIVAHGQQGSAEYPESGATGRPYGLVQAVDLDGDSYDDVVVASCQVEEYVAVLHNEAGKALKLLWSQFVEKDFPSDLRHVFQFSRAAVGTPRGNGQWDIGLIAAAGVFHCVDLATLQTRWKLDLGCAIRSSVTIVCGDVDGNGQDDFLVGLPNGDLVALAENLQSHEGEVLWKARLDYGIGEAILADVDGDGSMEVIVSTHEGRVRVLR